MWLTAFLALQGDFIALGAGLQDANAEGNGGRFWRRK
jgi:hypothetical protein